MKTICISLPDNISDVIDHYTGYLSITRSRLISSCIYELMLLHDIFDFDFFEHFVSVPFSKSFALKSSDSKDSTNIFDSSGFHKFINNKDSLFNSALKRLKIKGGHKND